LLGGRQCRSGRALPDFRSELARRIGGSPAPRFAVPLLAGWNKEANDPLGRYRVVMAEPEASVFSREPLSAAFVPR
jgi:hypothetical protein